MLLPLCFVNSIAYANNISKISAVKEMYASSLYYDSNVEEYNSDPDVIYSYADESLIKTLIAQEDFNLKNNGMCGSYVGPMMWGGSDDPFYDTHLNFSMNRDGKVKVELGYGGNVLYSLQCNQTSCKIKDIQTRGTSLKNNINKECR